jgi:hypothetical protein
MDLLERALALAACPLFADLAPAVVIRLAERAEPTLLAAGERRTTADSVWIVVDGSLVIAASGSVTSDATASVVRRTGGTARPGNVLGLVRVVAAQTPTVEAIAERATSVIGLSLDDMRDVLEEDPIALAALASALSRLLLGSPP